MHNVLQLLHFLSAGLDYTFSSESLTFDESTTIQCVQITINPDNILEEDEIFIVSLTTPDDDVTLSPDDSEVTITDTTGEFMNIYQIFSE